MKKQYVIRTDTAMYLHKGYPRAYRNGTCYGEMTKDVKNARKFATRQAAQQVLEDFTIFSGNEEIEEIL
jgi:hypothetical protein